MPVTERFRLSPVKRNIVANFVGRGWTTLMAIAFVPLYIRFLGIEAYGLIGFFATLQALFGILDMGLSTTMGREMARYSVQPDKKQEMCDVVRSLEAGYWLVGVLIAAIVIGGAPFLAHHWIRAQALSPAVVQQAVMIMGCVLAMQWPLSFYQGGLLGLQRQVMWNVLGNVFATVQGLGAVLILWLVSPTIQVFFEWQIVTSGLQTVVTALYLWKSLPNTGASPRPRWSLVKNISHFAVSMSATSLVIVALSQIDKVILSKVLPLKLFGYYTLAYTLACFQNIPSAPISQALLPRFYQLVAQGDEPALRRLYHRTCQLSSAATFPLAAMLVVFSRDALALWTHDQSLAAATYRVASVLVLGMALNTGFMNSLDWVQMAYGWLKPAFGIRLVALVIMGPLMTVMAIRHGALGAAEAWLIIYGFYMLAAPHFVFARYLKGEKLRWYLQDITLPLGVAFGSVLLWRICFPLPGGTPELLLYLVGAFATASIATAATTPDFRELAVTASARIARRRAKPDPT